MPSFSFLDAFETVLPEKTRTDADAASCERFEAHGAVGASRGDGWEWDPKDVPSLVPRFETRVEALTNRRDRTGCDLGVDPLGPTVHTVHSRSTNGPSPPFVTWGPGGRRRTRGVRFASFDRTRVCPGSIGWEPGVVPRHIGREPERGGHCRLVTRRRATQASMAARIAHVARGETKAMATVSSAKGNTCLGDRSRTKAGAAPTRRNVAATGLARSFVSSPKHLLHRRLYACGRAAAAVGEAKDVAIDSPWDLEDCRLVLSDGSILRGSAFGAKGTAVGEVVFNTALTGYQEILTDPSYAGQFVVFTQPHIGNTGINVDDMESGTQPSNKKQCHLGAIVVRRLSPLVSNYRSNMTLGEYLEKNNVIGIANVDTRALTRKLREGCQVGCISTDASLTDEQLQEKARGWSILGLDLIKTVSTKDVYEWDEGTDGEWEFNAKLKEIVASGSKPFNVVAYDFGIKTNILRRLASFNCKVTVVPCDYPAEKVLELNPEGIFFSNGPGDPSAAPYAVENAKKLLGKAPIFGICMGHQVLGQAFGSPTFKLKFGHHGGNHPIKHKPTGRIEISSQNHNYAVDPAQLPPEVEVTHVNLNDGTCAGMRNATLKAISIQYHPEASPGPHDADVCFEEFIDMMLKAR